MANVHRIGDLPNNNPQGNQGGIGGLGGVGGGGAGNQFSLPFSNIQGALTQNPQNETFWDMLKLSMCPNLQLKSATVFILVISLGFYIAAVVLGRGQLLFSPSVNSLIEVGAIEVVYLTQGQYWRLFTSCFLTTNIFTFVIQEFCILILAGNVEQMAKAKAIIVSYILCGVEAGLITQYFLIYTYTRAYFSQPWDIIITSNESFQGVFGLIIGYMVLNWESVPAQFRSQMICWVVIVVIFICFFGGTKAYIFGTLSAMLMGVFIGLWAIEPIRAQDHENKCKIVGMVSTGFFLFVSIFIFSKL